MRYISCLNFWVIYLPNLPSPVIYSRGSGVLKLGYLKCRSNDKGVNRVVSKPLGYLLKIFTRDHKIPWVVTSFCDLWKNKKLAPCSSEKKEWIIRARKRLRLMAGCMLRIQRDDLRYFLVENAKIWLGWHFCSFQQPFYWWP